MSRWIDIDDDRNCYIGNDGEYERWNIDPDVLDEAKPTFEPERKRGRWIHERLLSTTGGSYPIVRCSVCSGTIQFKWETRFCPNCGSRMVDKDG